VEVALGPGWAFSTGARLEAKIALQTSLRLIDIRGRELGAEDLQIMDEKARAQMFSDGWTKAEIDDYIPFVDFLGASLDRSDYDQSVKAFSDISERHNRESRERRSESD
jgi:hypothetical protein